MLYCIYTLSDPLSDETKYIGLTQNLKERYENHLWAGGEKNPKNSWIKNLKSKGLKPKLDIIDECVDIHMANELEVYWISQFKAWGFELKNITEGGGGKRPFGTPLHTRLLISKVLKEKYKKTPHKLKGVKWSIERRKNLSLKMKGRPHHWPSFKGKKHATIIKRVACYKENKLYKIYRCMLDASLDLNISVGNISNCCSGRQKTLQGYKFILLTKLGNAPLVYHYVYTLPVIGCREKNKRLHVSQVYNIKLRLWFRQNDHEICNMYNIGDGTLKDIKYNKTWSGLKLGILPESI